MVTRAGLGKLLYTSFDVCISQDSQGLIVDTDKVIPLYLAYILQDRVNGFKAKSQGSTIQGVTKGRLKSLEIPLPSREVQERLILEAEEKEQIVIGNQKLIDLMHNKIAEVLRTI